MKGADGGERHPERPLVRRASGGQSIAKPRGMPGFSSAAPRGVETSAETRVDPKEPQHYRAAGVDIDAGNALVEALKPLARATARAGSRRGAGRLRRALRPEGGGLHATRSWSPPPTASAPSSRSRSRPAATRPSASTSSPCASTTSSCRAPSRCSSSTTSRPASSMSAQAQRVIAGIAAACREVGCALIGGETAEMPGMYAAGDYDLAGFAVGAVERGAGARRHAPSRRATSVLGIASSGLHSNGFSLVRRVVEQAELDYARPRRSRRRRALPRRCCGRRGFTSKPAARRSTAGGVKALAHITGGGLLENIPRVLPHGARRRARRAALDACRRCFAGSPRPRRSRAQEMARTFNCGIGMVAVVAAERRERASRACSTRRRARCRDRPHRAARPTDAPARVIAQDGGGVARLKVAVLISGRGSNLAGADRGLRRAGLSRRDRARARPTAPTPPGLAHARARRHPDPRHCRTATSRRARRSTPRSTRALAAAGIELVCLAGFMRLFGAEFRRALARPARQHPPSLLPAFPGLDTHARALAAGRALHRLHRAFRARPRWTSGPIIVQAAVPVLPGDDAERARRARARGRASGLSAGARLIAEGRVRVRTSASRSPVRVAPRRRQSAAMRHRAG